MTYNNEENKANRLLNPLEATSQTGETPATKTSETSTQEKKDDEPTLLSVALVLLMFALFVMAACKVVKSGLDFGYDLYKSREPFEYRIDYGVATITKYKGKRSRVGVPAEIKGKPVVAIGDGAFSGCGLITEITLPDGLERIEANAFLGCRRLRKLTLPESVQIIGDSANEVDLTLYVAAGSYAEEYARENDIRFEVRNASATP